jgi:cell division protein FtsB
MLRALKYRLRALVFPVLFLAITWYFCANALHGARGLESQRIQVQQLANAQQAYTAVEQERSAWEARIGSLNGNSIAGDMLDKEARLVLNLADPGDLVVALPQGPGK